MEYRTIVPMQKSHRTVDSPIGPLTVVATDGRLSALYLQNHTHQPPSGTFGEPAPSDPLFAEVERQLAGYFAGTRTVFTVDLVPVGTAFQQQVWAKLRQIPYGRTWSYARLADELGDRRVIRAAAAANGRNPISILIPCHRVIGSDGSLTGYAGGLARKRFLLDLEAPPDAGLF